MADFNVDLAKPSASGAKPIAPVHDARTEFPNPWIGFGLGIAEALIKNQGEQQKKEQEAREAAVISNFTKEQTTLNDALMQGVPVSQVNARAMANFSKYSAAFPSLVDKFTKTNKSLFEHSQLGTAQSDVQMFRDARKNEIGEAVKSGVYLTEDMPQKVVDNTLEAYRKQKQAEAALDRAYKRNAEERASGTYNEAMGRAQLEKAVVTNLSFIADSHLSPTFERANHIVDQALKTGDKTGAQQLMQLFMPIESAITSVGGSNPSLAKPYKDMFDEMKKFSIERLSGKMTAEQSDNALKEMKNRMEMLTLSTPENKAIYSASKLFGGTIPSTYLETNAAGKDLIGRLSLSFTADSGQLPSIIGNKKVEGGAYDLIKNNIAMVESGKAPDAEGSKTQAGNLANNVLSQVGNSATRGIASKDLSTAYDFIASSDFKKLVEYGKIDKAAAAGAMRVFGSVYQREISEDMGKKLDAPFRTKDGAVVLSFADLVDFKWDGAGVVASQANIADKKARLDFMESGARDVFAKDMTKASTALNKLIKAGAHMEGHSDYEAYWEKNKSNLLPNIYPPEAVKPNSIHTIEGKQFKYLGGTPWKRAQYWEEVKVSE